MARQLCRDTCPWGPFGCSLHRPVLDLRPFFSGATNECAPWSPPPPPAPPPPKKTKRKQYAPRHALQETYNTAPTHQGNRCEGKAASSSCARSPFLLVRPGEPKPPRLPVPNPKSGSIFKTGQDSHSATTPHPGARKNFASALPRSRQAQFLSLPPLFSKNSTTIIEHASTPVFHQGNALHQRHPIFKKNQDKKDSNALSLPRCKKAPSLAAEQEQNVVCRLMIWRVPPKQPTCPLQKRHHPTPTHT